MAKSRRELNLQRTRQKILAAAREEFAAKGMAGARTAAIARRAGVKKGMLHYCFRSKKDLYRQILRAAFTRDAEAIKAIPDDLGETLVYWFDLFGSDAKSFRLFQWGALEVGGKLIANAQPRQVFKIVLARMRRWQAQGRIPSSLDVGQLYLSMVALTIFPRAFPQLSRLMTGYTPGDSRFRDDCIEFFRWLGGRLQVSDPAAQHGGILKAKA